MIKGVIAGVRDLRGTADAVLGNDSMNARIERGEIEGTMKEIRESAPGKDGDRIGYIRYASEEVKERVIGLEEDAEGERKLVRGRGSGLEIDACK